MTLKLGMNYGHWLYAVIIVSFRLVAIVYTRWKPSFIIVCVVCDVVQELKMCCTRMENASVDSRQWTTFYSRHNHR